jgi:Ulp1 family protease
MLYIKCTLILIFYQKTVVQTNGYDCGIWVLAMITATLHGCHCTGLKEDHMSAFRHYLHTLVVLMCN